ncbi:hypothetical protein KJ611_03420 [Patescibacteria group bacterium]|nr:hypothetical protein [Patescibacteria group bacterium]MBU1705771.1 hypothetical protein [Patescibacteria group bacterium]
MTQNQNRNRNTTTGNNRRYRRHENEPTKLTKFSYATDGGSLDVVTGPMHSVHGYLQRTKDKIAISAISLSTLLKQAIVSVIVFKSDKPGMFSTKTLIPKAILDEVYRTASYYSGVPIQMAWLRLFGDLDHKVRVASFDSEIFNDNFGFLVNRFMKEFSFIFKGGLLNGHADTNTLVLTAPYNPKATRQTYASNGTNFGPLPTVTDKSVCQSVFGKNLLVQAERGGNIMFGLTSQNLSDYLNHKIAKPDWVKAGKFDGNIIELSSIPVNAGVMVVTTERKGDRRFDLVRVNWDKDLPVIRPDRQIQVMGIAPVIRTDQNGIITYGSDLDNSFIGIIPTDQLGSEFAGLIATPPVASTLPNIM